MFWITLGAFILGSVMCWFNDLRKIVVVCWGLWLAGFFILPLIFGTGWAFLVLQAALAVVLLIRWKAYDALG